MKRICAVCLLIALACGRAVAADKLNVVLIAVDDMNTNLSCYGHPIVRSPNIDRLAARGVRFERAYCQYPVCNASRVSMLAGLRPDTTRIMDLVTPPRTYLKDVVFLPQYFRQQGYFTGHVGKIFHTGPEFEDPPSWDVEIRETGKTPPDEAVVRQQEIDRPLKYGLKWMELKWPDEQTADGVVATQACQMLEQKARGGQPFFIAVGFRRPHSPYAAPAKYFAMYPPERIKPLFEPAAHLQAIPPSALTYPVGTPQVSREDRQQVVAAYYGCISFVDAQIGRVLDALDRLELWKNTVVVFYSDHGYHLGEHGGMWHKMSVFEQSARVPLIVAAPTVNSPGQSSERVVELLDIYPTLVELCSLPTIAALEGRSLRILLEDPRGPFKPAAYTQVLRGDVMGRSVRDERYRYTEWDEARQGAELYDYLTDPMEWVNLANKPEATSTQAKMRELLRQSRPPAKQALIAK